RPRPLRDRPARPHTHPARRGRRGPRHHRLLPQPSRPSGAGLALRHGARLGGIRLPDRRHPRRQARRRQLFRRGPRRGSLPLRAAGGFLKPARDGAAAPATRWLNRNVAGIGLADLAADSNYEMVLAVLPLFITGGLGAPVFTVGLVEGVADGSSALIKVWSGWYSDRIAWRKRLAVGGYGATGLGFALLVAVASWPQVLVSRAFAWVGRGLRQPIRQAMLAGSVDKRDLGKAFGFHEAMDTAGAIIGPATAFILLATQHGFRTVFAVAIVPAVLAVVLFAVITRDPRRGAKPAAPPDFKLPRPFWRLMVPVAVFGAGNFATAFFTLRVVQMLQPELGHTAAVAAAVGFYLAHNVVGTLVSFP